MSQRPAIPIGLWMVFLFAACGPPSQADLRAWRESKSIDKLTEVLLDRDAETELRASASKALIEIGPEAIPKLISALPFEQYDFWVNGYFLESLTELGGPAVAEALSEELIAGSGNEYSILGSLEKMGRPEALPGVLHLVRTEKNETVLKRAIRVLAALGDSHDPQVLEAMDRHLKGDDRKVSQVAAKALGSLGGAGAAEVLASSLSSLEWVADPLVGIGLPAVGVLKPLLQEIPCDGYFGFCGKAAVLLDRIGAADGLEPLLQLAEAHGQEIRGCRGRVAAAVLALDLDLNAISDPRLPSALMNGLQRSDPEDRAKAMEYFLVLAEKEGMETLLQRFSEIFQTDPTEKESDVFQWFETRKSWDWLVQTPELTLWAMVHAAHRRLDGMRVQDQKELAKTGVLAAKAARRTPEHFHEVTPYLIRILGDNTPLEYVDGESWIPLGVETSPAEEAAKALNRFPQSIISLPLVAALGSSNPKIRSQAKKAIDPNERLARLALHRALRHSNSELRAGAVEVLAAAKDSKVLDWIQDLAADPEASVREAVARALEQGKP
ncbi:MAG: HEAT repeat domain-containing protein [Planctomycetota bacterium]|nr:MAG: HEAT repeat domain-containing protein [Planctomycetota bacterium]